MDDGPRWQESATRVQRRWLGPKLVAGCLVIAIGSSVVAASLMTAASIVDAISRPGQWAAAIAFLVLDGLRVVRAQLQRQIQMTDGLRFAAKLDKHGSDAGVCFGGVGFQFERQLKLPQGFRDARVILDHDDFEGVPWNRLPPEVVQEMEALARQHVPESEEIAVHVSPAELPPFAVTYWKLKLPPKPLGYDAEISTGSM